MSGSKDWNRLGDDPRKPPKKTDGKKDLQELMRNRFNRASSATSSSSSNNASPVQGASGKQDIQRGGASSAFHRVQTSRGAGGASPAQRQSPMRDENGNHLTDQKTENASQGQGQKYSQSMIATKSVSNPKDSKANSRSLSSRSSDPRTVARSSSRAIEDEALNTVLGEVVQEKKKPEGSPRRQGASGLKGASKETARVKEQAQGDSTDQDVDMEGPLEPPKNQNEEASEHAYNRLKNMMAESEHKNRGREEQRHNNEDIIFNGGMNAPGVRRGGGFGHVVHMGGRPRGGIDRLMKLGAERRGEAGGVVGGGGVPPRLPGEGSERDMLAGMMGQRGNGGMAHSQQAHGRGGVAEMPRVLHLGGGGREGGMAGSGREGGPFGGGQGGGGMKGDEELARLLQFGGGDKGSGSLGGNGGEGVGLGGGMVSDEELARLLQFGDGGRGDGGRGGQEGDAGMAQFLQLGGGGQGGTGQGLSGAGMAQLFQGQGRHGRGGAMGQGGVPIAMGRGGVPIAMGRGGVPVAMGQGGVPIAMGRGGVPIAMGRGGVPVAMGQGGVPIAMGQGGVPGAMGQGGVPIAMGQGGVPGAIGQGQEEDQEFDPEKMDLNKIMEQLIVYERVKAANCRDPRSEGMCTLILVDTSASMAGEPMAQAAEFISHFLNGLEEIQFEYGLNENVALGVFGAEVHIEQHLTHNYPLIKRALDTLMPEGPTQLLLSLMLIQSLFDRHVFEDRADCIVESNGHHILPRVILISDGFPTQSADPPGEQHEPNQETKALQNVCAMANQKLYEELLFRLYCVPVGNAQEEFLSVLASSTEGGLLRHQDGRQASHCFLHHFLVGQLMRDGRNIHDPEVVASAVKQVMGTSDEKDVDGVMSIIRDGEPDLKARDAKIAKEAQQTKQLREALQQRGLLQGGQGSEEAMRALMSGSNSGGALMSQLLAAGGQGEQMGQMVAALGGEEAIAQALMGAQGGDAMQQLLRSAGAGRGGNIDPMVGAAGGNPAMLNQLMGAAGGGNSSGSVLSGARGRGQVGLSPQLTQSMGANGIRQADVSPQLAQSMGLPGSRGSGGQSGQNGGKSEIDPETLRQIQHFREISAAQRKARGIKDDSDPTRFSLRRRDSEQDKVREPVNGLGAALQAGGIGVPAAGDGLLIQPNLNPDPDNQRPEKIPFEEMLARLKRGEPLDGAPQVDASEEFKKMIENGGGVENDPIASFIVKRKENAHNEKNQEGNAVKGAASKRRQKRAKAKKDRSRSHRHDGGMGGLDGNKKRVELGGMGGMIELGGMGGMVQVAGIGGMGREDTPDTSEDDVSMKGEDSQSSDSNGSHGSEDEGSGADDNAHIVENALSDPNEFGETSGSSSEDSWSKEKVVPKKKKRKPISMEEFLFGKKKDRKQREIPKEETMVELLRDLWDDNAAEEFARKSPPPEEPVPQPGDELGGLGGLFQPGFGQGRGLGFGRGGGHPLQIQGLGAGQNQRQLLMGQRGENGGEIVGMNGMVVNGDIGENGAVHHQGGNQFDFVRAMGGLGINGDALRGNNQMGQNQVNLNSFANGGLGQNDMGLNIRLGQNGGMGLLGGMGQNGGMDQNGGIGLLGGMGQNGGIRLNGGLLGGNGGFGGLQGQGLDEGMGQPDPDQVNELLQALGGLRGNGGQGHNGMNGPGGMNGFGGLG